jgi:hypothetical protein
MSEDLNFYSASDETMLALATQAFRPGLQDGHGETEVPRVMPRELMVELAVPHVREPADMIWSVYLAGFQLAQQRRRYGLLREQALDEVTNSFRPRGAG